MPYRKIALVNGYFYHVFNRGVEKRKIFANEDDKSRFLKTLIYYQFVGPKPRFSRFNPDIRRDFKTDKIVNIVAYCFMPNHFHLLLRQKEDNGISEFVGKISNSYTKYFNTKYKRVGPLLQGVFRAVQIANDEQLVHLSRYIHLNPYVSGLVTNLNDYPWSSYQYFVGGNNTSSVEKDEILTFFSSPQAYEKFVLDHQDYAKTLDLIKHELLEND